MELNWKSVSFLFLSAIFGGALVSAYHSFKPEMASYVSAKESAAPADIGALIQRQKDLFQNFDSMFGDNFFQNEDPFEDMRKFRERFEKEFPYRNRGSTSPFDSWFGDRFGGGNVKDITKKEDDRFVYFEITLAGLEGESLKTSVENGYVTISGEVRGESKGVGAIQSIYRSSFRRSFPLPENIDSAGMQVESEKDKLILKFPKAKA